MARFQAGVRAFSTSLVLSIASAACITVPDHIGAGIDGSVDASATDAPGSDGGFSARKRTIRLVPSVALSETLGPIAVAIRLTDDADYTEHGRAMGTDLVVTLTGSTDRLPYELELANPVGGDLLAWVQLPGFPPTGGVSVDLYYGGAEETQSEPLAVFGDALLAWHFASQVDPLAVVDSAGGVDGTADFSIARAVGPFGDAATLGGNTITTTANSSSIYPGSGDLGYTISFWMQSNSAVIATLLEIGNPAVGSGEPFGVKLRSTTTQWALDTQAPDQVLSRGIALQQIANSQWNHCAIRVTRTDSSILIDLKINGASPSVEFPVEHTSSATLGGTLPLILGSIQANIDELRIYRRDRSDSELLIERESGTLGSFYTYEPVVAADYP